MDCQVIILNSSGVNIDMSELQRVTEYIIAYATKGNEREVDAMNAVQNIILSLRETGSESDVIRAVCKALNYYLGSKTISKQEAMVLMGKLDLWKCTESIQHVHTNKHHQLSIVVVFVVVASCFHSHCHHCHLLLLEFFRWRRMVLLPPLEHAR